MFCASNPALPAGQIATTLLAGATPQAREQACYAFWQALPAKRLALPSQVFFIIEGFASGSSPLAEISGASVQIQRLAPACLCCSGNMVLNVHLNRLIRQVQKSRQQSDVQLVISLADAEHLTSLRAKLTAPPFQQYLQLLPDCLLT
ncbi:MAG: GTPase [Burkholderiales bacterium]|nr:GTPase [Burkholderiales bacterium]